MMLKNHMQPIVAYFANASKHEASEVKAGKAAQSSNHKSSKSNVNPMQPIVNYFDQQSSSQHNSKAQSKSLSQQIKTGLGRFWHRVMTIDTDPQIRQRRNHSGQSYWQVYDPISQTSQRFFEEEEVYRWLERRYYI
jgi:type IV secretory pathway TrbF-like protein